MRFLRPFGRFWYDLVVGDDWKIATAVVVALAALLVALRLRLFGEGGLAVFGGVAIMAGFVVSVLVDVRADRKR